MIERIGIQWPREVDVEGFPPEYAETVRARELPFDMEDPLIFHVLTTVDNDAELLQIMSQGGALLPRSWANERWGDKKSMIFARDVAAGDDDYLFMTPCNTFSDVHDRGKNPAVAFRLSYVLKRAKVAFRVHDLEPQYKQVEESLVNADAIGWGYDDEYDWDTGMDEQDERFEEESAETVREQLEALADCGTQYDSEKAVALTLLYADICGLFRQEGMWVPEDDYDRVRIFKAARPLFPDCIHEYLVGEAEWAQELFIERQVDALTESWEKLFMAPGVMVPSFPSRLLAVPGFERPELLVQGELDLCDAAFYRTEEGAWLPVPAWVCEARRIA